MKNVATLSKNLSRFAGGDDELKALQFYEKHILICHDFEEFISSNVRMTEG